MQASAWIAIIDDDPSVLMALTRALRIRGLQVKTYTSARQFVTAITDELPACLIVDIQMPDMTGLELLHYLRNRSIFIPSIIITAHGDPTMRERCEDAGAVAFF